MSKQLYTLQHLFESLGAGWLTSRRAIDVGSEDWWRRASCRAINLMPPTKEVQEAFRAAAVKADWYPVVRVSKHYTKNACKGYAWAVSAAKEGLDLGGTGKRYYHIICYTLLLLHYLHICLWKRQFRFAPLVFTKKRVSQGRG